MIKITKNNKMLEITSPYNQAFIKEVKKIGGKWNGELKVWVVEEEFEERLNNIIFKVYNYDVTGKEEVIKIKYSAKDFFVYKTSRIEVAGRTMVYRESKNRDVSFKNNTVILEGDFPERGGSNGHPNVFGQMKFGSEIPQDEDVILRSEIFKKDYDRLSDEEKSKITIL